MKTNGRGRFETGPAIQSNVTPQGQDKSRPNTYCFKISILVFLVLVLSGCSDVFEKYKTSANQITDAKNLPFIRETVTKRYQSAPQELNNIFNYGSLKMVDSSTTSGYHEAVNLFDAYLQKQPKDLTAQMRKGCALVLLAELYLDQKNYFKAAEYSKMGFYFMDEAVEQKPDDLSLRLMRGRFDSQTPKALGRYVIAIKDITYLLANKNKMPPSLEPVLYFLLAKIHALAGNDVHSKAQLAALEKAYPHHPLLKRPLGPRVMIPDDELLAMFRL